jgi:hypothetical protein
MRKSFPLFRDTDIYDKLYDILEARPDGVSEQMLSRQTGLTIGTIRKNLERMKDDDVAERAMHADRFVWKLTTADSLWERRWKKDAITTPKKR